MPAAIHKKGALRGEKWRGKARVLVRSAQLTEDSRDKGKKKRNASEIEGSKGVCAHGVTKRKRKKYAEKEKKRETREFQIKV